MTNAKQFCCACGRTATTWAVGPWQVATRPTQHVEGRWYYCAECNAIAYREAREWAANKAPVIVDIDGTVFDIEGRDPYADNPRVLCWDRPNLHVRAIVTALAATGRAIVYVSARHEATREVTIEGLISHGFGLDGTIRLLMRADDDMRADTFIKREILEWLRQGGIEPAFAIDDRPSVIRKVWQAAGIPVVQVGRSVGVGGDF